MQFLPPLYWRRLKGDGREKKDFGGLFLRVFPDFFQHVLLQPFGMFRFFKLRCQHSNLFDDLCVQIGEEFLFKRGQGFEDALFDIGRTGLGKFIAGAVIAAEVRNEKTSVQVVVNGAGVFGSFNTKFYFSFPQKFFDAGITEIEVNNGANGN